MRKNNKILIINTGGTFNKKYDPISGKLYIDRDSTALHNLSEKWMCDLEIKEIIGKDSLEMSSHDRLELLATISQASFDKILVIHGTDTLSLTAEYLADAEIDKCIVLTGAMVPYAINPVEATANFSSAYGILQILQQSGVFVSMHGIFSHYNEVKKDRKKGRFVRV